MTPFHFRWVEEQRGQRVSSRFGPQQSLRIVSSTPPTLQRHNQRAYLFPPSTGNNDLLLKITSCLQFADVFRVKVCELSRK